MIYLLFLLLKSTTNPSSVINAVVFRTNSNRDKVAVMDVLSQEFLFWRATSVGNAAAILHGIQFQIMVWLIFINGKTTFTILRSQPRNRPDFIILEICVFDNFILAIELFAKVLQYLASYLSVSNVNC